jgi:predicted house-cleaning noncanonical NTP pyrophosphatase (MazG superfamily)
MSQTIIHYQKLVRDEIPKIIESNGDVPTIRILGDNEYLEALYVKLHEETNELANASESEQLSELADVLEVVLSAADALGFSQEKVEKAMLDKRAERGGFTKRIWLEKTSNK